MRRRKDQIDDVREAGEASELPEKEQKKLKQKTIIDKRKEAKRKDKVARWGGIILLGLTMFVGFLLWVSGEMKNDPPTSVQDETSLGSQSVIVK